MAEIIDINEMEDRIQLLERQVAVMQAKVMGIEEHKEQIDSSIYRLTVQIQELRKGDKDPFNKKKAP